jgi:Transposase IS116/IS110/IS902 family
MALPLPGRLRSEVAPLLAVMRHLEPPLADADERIAAVTQTDDRVRWLPSVPNIGPVTAAAFVAALDPAARFRRAHEVEASLGLVPRELSSGETQRCGRMTKAGSSRVRWLLIQAAVSMLRLRDARTAHLREWGDRIAARRGKAIAVVALARRLAGILFALLRDGTVYTSRHRPLAAAPGVAGVRVWQVMSRGRDPARGTRRWRVLVLAIVSAGYPAAPARPPRRPVSGSLDAARHQSRRGRGGARSRRHQGGPGSLPDGGPPSPPAIALAATPVDLPDHLCHHCAALDHAEQPAGSESTTQ